MSLSLRARLTLAIVLVTGPAVAGSVAALYLAVDEQLWSEFDQESGEMATIFANLVEYDPEDGYEIEGGVPIAATFLESKDPAHIEIRAGSTLLLGGPRPKGVQLRETQVTVQPRIDPHLAGQLDPDPVTITVARETAGTRAMLEAIATWFWLLGTASVLLTTAVAGVVVHRAMAPVRRLARQMDAVGDPDDRLAVATGDLPAELAPMARKLEALLERLREAFARERRFTANVSHELRTPLCVLRADLDAALAGEAPPPQRQRLERLRDTVDGLTVLVEQLLSLSRAQSGQLTLRLVEVPLAPLVEECFAPLKEHADARQISLTNLIDPSTTFTADEASLRVIVRNLLQNAVSYAPAGARIEARFLQNGLEVWNEGPSLDPDTLQQAFTAFWRADQTRTDARRSGIGLALCQALARAHNRSLTLQNAPKGGILARLH